MIINLISQILLFVFPVFNNGHWFFINDRGETIRETKYDYISTPNAAGNYIVGNKTHYGLVNDQGMEVIPVKYDKITFLFDSTILTLQNQKYTLLNSSYKPICFDTITKIQNILSYRHYLNDTSDIGNGQNTYMLRTPKGKIGFISKVNFLKPEYDSYVSLNEKYFKIQKGDNFILTDIMLNKMSENEFEYIEDVGGYYVVQKNKLFGLLSSNLTEIIKPSYANIAIRTFFDKPYLICKSVGKPECKLYDLESESFLITLPYDDLSELENGDLVDDYNGFPKLIQIFKNNRMGVFDMQKKNILITPIHNGLGYINKDRFVIYDDYSKFKIYHNNLPISKDTILGYVMPFDSLPVTFFYKDVMDPSTNKLSRFYGAFNLKGEVIVPYPVKKLRIHASKITFENNKGNKSVVKYDETGTFEEYIENYTSIFIHDTTETSRTIKKQRCKPRSINYKSNYQIMYVTETAPNNQFNNSIILKKVYSRDLDNCINTGGSLIDIHINNLNKYGVAPAFTSKDFTYRIVDAKNRKVVEVLPVTANGKTMKKNFAFISHFVDGLAAVDFSNVGQTIGERKMHNLKYFDIDADENNFYSGDFIPIDYRFHKGNWGFVDTSCRLVIAPKYTNIELFNKGVSIVQENEKYYLINKKGEQIFPTAHALILRTPIDTLFIFKDHFGGIGFLDKSFKTRVQAEQRSKIDAPGNSIFPVFCKNKKWAFRHFNGQWITDSIFNSIKPFTDGFALVSSENKWGYIDTSGKLTVPIIYEEGRNMQCKRAFVKLNGKDHFVLIDNLGNKIGKTQYQEVHPFEQDLAIVSNDGLWGVIDINGDWIYKNEFTSISPFNKYGEAKAIKAGKTFIISSEKNIREFEKAEMTFEKKQSKLDESEIREFNAMINEKFKGIALYPEKKLFYKNSISETDILPFVQPYKCGLTSNTGKVILSAEFQDISYYAIDIFKVYKDNNIGYYSIRKGWLYKPWQ